MQAFEYREPGSLDEALELLAERGDEAKVVAGGTALVILLKQRLLAPSCLVSVRRVGALKGMKVTDAALELGATETHRSMETSALVKGAHPVLSETYAHVATLRVRNMATVGGSLAHADPNQDPPVTLLALGASVHLASKQGSRVVPLEEFFKDYYETVARPDELVTGLTVPRMPAHSGAAYLKYLPRTVDDYATVGAAACVTLDAQKRTCVEARVALGCVAATPIRARASEELLRGQTLTDDLLREAGRAAEEATDPIGDARGSSSYKRAMAGVFARRALKQAWERAGRANG